MARRLVRNDCASAGLVQSDAKALGLSRPVPELLDHIKSGRIDPSFVVTHRIPLSEAPEGYHLFREKRDGCIKVVLDPAA